jgi:uncharacterized membrane protein
MFHLSNHWALFLLLLIPYAYYLSRKSLTDLSKRRKWLAFTVRSILILLFVFSLSGLQFVCKSDKLCTIFALDVSNSILESESRKALEFINRSVDAMKDNDMAGLVVFGKEAYVDIPPKSKPKITSISSDLDRQYTNINSIISAMNLFPTVFSSEQNMQKGVVLITDGNENIGNITDEAIMMMKANGVQLYTVPLQTRLDGKNEVFISNLISPVQVNLGRSFELKAILVSNFDTKATIKLFKDRNYVTEKRINVSKLGKNVVTFQQALDTEGMYIYEAIVEPETDTLRENNHAQCVITASGKPRILYFNGNKSETYLPQVLKQKGVEVSQIVDSSSMPSSLAEMQNYKAIIFDNVPANSLFPDQMLMIEKYVHDLGGGFLMIGGENSFGSGGYFNTNIEKILPVKMIPEKKKRSVSIALLIDRSGSMNTLSGRFSKIELAKEAAISVIDVLTDKDKIGVVAFDAQAEEVVRLQGIQTKPQIIDKISHVRARGGTNMYPALKMAYEWLAKADTQLKHIIIVSDGQSLQMNESLNFVKKLSQESITVSTIAISDEADKKAMQDMARTGSGRYYETIDASTLPRILIKETLMSSDLIVEKAFQPIASGSSEIFNGINTKSLPSLLGYIQTSSKEGSEVLLKSDQEDPILSVWQYGLGRTIAFTSDALPKWAIEWLKWSDFSKFWSQAIGWCLPVLSGEFEILANVTGSKGELAVNVVGASGQFRNFLELQANVVNPDLISQIVSLKQSGIGRYEAEFDASQMGTYMLSVAEIVDGKPKNWQKTGIVVSYSPEYTDLESNVKLLQDVVNNTNGIYNPSPEAIFGNRSKRVWMMGEIWKWLLIASIPLFFFDIAIRRITISREQILQTFKREKPKTLRSNTFENLKSHKQKIIDAQVIQRVSIQPKPKSEQQKITDKPTGSYTSRLLEAKKRAESRQI